MTIDERLEKLTERHEALAQAMELNASLQRDHDQRMRQAIEALSQGVEALASLHADNERRMGGMMDAITRLGNIVADHDIRLDNLERRQ
jgi:iron-sulfur cluster repair protein YtfE (RIC family)